MATRVFKGEVHKLRGAAGVCIRGYQIVLSVAAVTIVTWTRGDAAFADRFIGLGNARGTMLGGRIAYNESCCRFCESLGAKRTNGGQFRRVGIVACQLPKDGEETIVVLFGTRGLSRRRADGHVAWRVSGRVRLDGCDCFGRTSVTKSGRKAAVVGRNRRISRGVNAFGETANTVTDLEPRLV